MKHKRTRASVFSTGWMTAILIAVAGCEIPEVPRASLNLRDVLTTDETLGFERAYEKRQFDFPADHGSHPGFRNEWWYFTGNLATGNDRHFGYQVTFFRTALSPVDISPPAQTSGSRSTWTVRDIWMVHAAVTDISAGLHHAEQRFSRSGPRLAGVEAEPFQIWLDDWHVSEPRDAGEGDLSPWHISIDADRFVLELDLRTEKKKILQGDHGLSRKSAVAGNASYYYSYTRLATQGQLVIKDSASSDGRDGNDGQKAAASHYNVTGYSWFDREWSTSSLGAGQIGWDWFSLQFDTGEELMYYQLLDRNGEPDSHSQGSWIDKAGRKTSVTRQDMQLTILKTWRAPDGQIYPIEWQMDYLTRDQSWIVRAAVADQFMDLAVQYWEGAVEIHDATTMELLGRGYLEMTRIN